MANKTKTINAGPVGIKPRGTYSSTDRYTLLDCVLYNHDSWVCVAMNQDGEAIEITGQTPADGSQYWKALTDGGRAAVATGTQVRTDFDTWFGATAESGIRKTVSDWLTSVQTAWTTWFGADANSGVRKTFSDWYAQIQQTWTTWFGADDTSGVQKQWKDTKADATTATGRANTAAALCEEWNSHPPYVADGTQEHPGDENYWYTYDITTEQYVKGPYAKGDNLQWDDMTQAEKDALAQLVLDHILFDDVPTENSDKAVKSGGIYTALGGKQDTLTFASVETCEDIVEELI